MLPFFHLDLTVPAAAIDDNGHVNNVVYIQWMQDVATAHADQAGYGVSQCLAYGGTWVVRSHHIDYLGSARLGDHLRLETWVAELGRTGCQRHYRFLRASDGKTLAKARSHYVHVRADNQRPQALPASLVEKISLKRDEG